MLLADKLLNLPDFRAFALVNSLSFLFLTIRRRSEEPLVAHGPRFATAAPRAKRSAKRC
jgi:hypothetical protein